MCLPPVTKSAHVTWYKQAKGVQPEKMHMPNASSLEEMYVMCVMCMVTLAILLALLGWHICVMT